MTGEELVSGWGRQALSKCSHLNLRPLLGLSSEKAALSPKYIIGADEVGSGCLAGPVMVCAFMAPVGWKREGLRDSKKLTARNRGLLFPELELAGVGHHVARFSNTMIDKVGINTCLQLLYEECILQLHSRFPGKYEDTLVVFDGTTRARYVDHASLPKGDDIVPHISAASVLAKVTRDRWMASEAHRLYPAYGFDEHVGYGTDVHRAALVYHGVTPIHRMSFLKNLEKWRTECS